MSTENSSAPGSKENVNSVVQSTVTLYRDNVADNYDPFEHRKVEHPTSTLGAFFHLLKSSLGSGLLAMPAAFKNIGIIPGCIGTVLVGIIATHCVHILYWSLADKVTVLHDEKCLPTPSDICNISDVTNLLPASIVVSTSRQVCKESKMSSLSYTDTCERAFKLGPPKLRSYSVAVRHFADCAMAGICIGGTSVYVLFIATSLKDICDYLAPSNQLSVEAYCGILLLPLILITQIRYLKFLVPFSIFANVCLFIVFGITCYYTFDIPQPIEAKMFVSITKWPLFLSTAIFAMEGINVVMPVENEMAKPQHFLGCPGVLNFTMVFVALLYGIVGVFGYLKYGDAVLGSITLNLPQNEVLALIAKVLIATAVFFTYCLQMYAPMDIIWTRLSNNVNPRYHNISQIALRTVSVAFTVTLAVVVPDLELLIGLVGAIFFSTLGLLIPAVVQTVHKWDRGLGPFKYILWKNILLITFYLIVLLTGCYTSISAIKDKYK